MIFTLLAILALQTTSLFQPDATIQQSDSLIARNWTVEEGLPVNAVNNVVQDDRGYIWFTTYDGIVRFNGIDFKVFNRSNTPEMPQNRAVNIYHQKGTGMWVSLENGGILLLSDQGNEYFGEDEGLPRSDLTTMYEDTHGKMWFGTYQGLYRYENGDFERVFTRSRSSQNRINALFEAGDGSLWIATYDGLVHLKNEETQFYNRNPGTVDNEFTQIIEGPDGNIWVGTRTGLFVLNDGEFEQPDVLKPLDDEFVAALYKYKGDWLISTDRGFYLYDGALKQLQDQESQYESFQHFYEDSRGVLWLVKNNGEIAWLIDGEVVTPGGIENLQNYYFNRVSEDREGNIWLTTARSGIVRITQSRAQMIGQAEGLSGGNILGLFEDSRGRFWVGTRDEGINVIDGEEVSYLSEQEEIASDIVHTINEDKQGNIWVGYYQQGIDRFNEEGVKNYRFGSDAFQNDVRAIHVAQDSAIWLGTYGGLIKFDPLNENHTVYTEADGLAGNLVRYIDEAPDGSLWIGTGDGGVSHFKDGAFKNYTTADGLSSENVRSVYVDEEDPSTVWVGTEVRGLNRIQNDEISFITVEDGLPDHIIHYVSGDGNGWLWMSSNRGVMKIFKRDLNAFLDGEQENFRLAHYGKSEGMRNPECNGSFQQGGLRTSNGTFWFSTQEGIAVFDIDPSSGQESPTPVEIDYIFADGREHTEKNIDLEAGVDDFQVYFHAITFVSPEKTVYRYMLEGYDEGWQETIGTREVYYNDIPPGEYNFRVMAAGNGGRWSSQEATLYMDLNPMFYQQWWFYGVVFLLLGIGYYGVSQARYSYLMRRQKRMQQVIDEQTEKLRREKNAIEEQNKIIEQQAQKLEESNQAKDRFFSIIGHDLRNPFQALVGYSSMVRESLDTMDRVEIGESMGEIKKASERLLELVGSLLSWASLQTEKVKPNPEMLIVNELIEKNINLLSHSAEQKDIRLEFNPDNMQQIYADRNMIDTILRNLISNAIKFTGRGGKVAVESEFENETCIIRISDTGIGMPPDMVERLMSLDKKTSRFGTENETGSGLGLIICKEMITLHNGTIEVESEEGEGTTFTVYIPKNNFRKTSG